MLKTIFLALALVFSFSSFAPAGTTQIDFYEARWKDVVKKAEAENKPIFVMAYASWCANCKKMQKYVFTDKEVGEYINKNFVSTRLNADQGGERSRIQGWGTNAVPSIIFLSSDGKDVLHLAKGFKDKETFMKEVNTALEKIHGTGAY